VTRRIGLLLPAANITVEAEAATVGIMHFQRFAPVLSGDVSASTVKAAIVDAACILAAVRPARIGVAYATGSYLEPQLLDKELIEEIEDATGAQATTAARALVERLRGLGSRRVTVVSPYGEVVNAGCRSYLEAHGLQVAALVGEPPAGLAGEVSPEDVRALVFAAPRADVDAIVISCTGLRTLSLLAELRRECGVPVISSNEALLAAVNAPTEASAG
jgi:maleate isomerase